MVRLWKKHIAVCFLFMLPAAVAFVLPAADTMARDVHSPYFMSIGGPTSQPIGHYDFCQRHHSECTIHSPTTRPPKLTPYGWSLVRKVNNDVNREIIPMTDMELYGREEYWAYPIDAGDCEDYVLEKRRRLIKLGFSVGDLLITVVRKKNGEGHAVLTVRTSKGDFILDNLDNDVKLWSETPYLYLKRQSSRDSGKWVSINRGASLLVSSLKN